MRIACALKAGVLLAACIPASGRAANPPTPVPAMSRGESRNVFGYDPTADFVAFDPQYGEKHRKYASELRELQLELARQTTKRGGRRRVRAKYFWKRAGSFIIPRTGTASI